MPSPISVAPRRGYVSNLGRSVKGIIVLMAVGLMLRPASGEAQSITVVLSKLQELEEQIVGLEQARRRDVSRLQDEVADIKSSSSDSDGGAASAEVGELGARVAQLELELVRQRETLGGDPVAQRVDSLAVVLGSLIERLAASLDAPPDPGPAPGAPQQAAPPPAGPSVTFGGQVRPRFESRSFAADESTDDWYTSMRVRGAITANLDRKVKVFIQFQDVRLFGEESNTLGDFRADNFDLHQGYVEASEIGGRPVAARVGRQAVAFGGQRLVGAVEWAQQGRVFDGARVTIGSKGPKVDVFGMRLAESSSKAVDTDASFLGVYAAFPNVGVGTLDLYGLYDQVSVDARTAQATFGARWHGSRDGVAFRVEGSHQSGQRAGKDVSAYMFGVRVGTSVAQGRATVTAWYDYVSGDDSTDDEVQSFSTLFATNHKYYGFADLFLNVPVHTGGHGLQDFAVKFSVNAGERTKVGVDLHSFRAAQVGGLTSSHFADEADLTVNYKFSKQLSVVGGFSYVFARDGFAEIGRFTDNQSFTYLMTNVAF